MPPCFTLSNPRPPAVFIVAMLVALARADVPARGAAADYPYLSWQDEFDGSTVDSSRWVFDIGTGSQFGLTGWGNNELQYYTDRPQNATVSGGALRITARQESFGGQAYTSARLKTLGKFDQAGGRFEIRAALPTGQGFWPAIWMLPAGNAYGGWAASGELDIMEARGQQPDRVHGTIHYGGSWPNNVNTSATRVLPAGQSIAAFHTYAVEWDTTSSPAIRWYVDDVLYATRTSWWSSGGAYPAPFDKPFHMLLNVAVGGDYVGSPNASTVFPATMQVDYVRAYTAAPPAATLTWYGDRTRAGGSGTWTMTSTWHDGASVRPWAPGSRAVFSGSAGTVTLGAPTAVNGGLQFQSSGYTLAGAGLVLGGTAGSIDVATAATATITAAISGSAGLAKAGGGTLVLDAVNAFTGTASIRTGTLALGRQAAVGAVSLVDVAANAALNVQSVAGGYSVGSGQTLAGSGTVLGSVVFGRSATLSPGAAGAVAVQALGVSAPATLAAAEPGSIEIVGVPEPHGLVLVGIALGCAGLGTLRRGRRVVPKP